jgi:hypothetical protein
VVITTRWRAHFWFDHCAGGADRDWETQLIASVVGTGNVASTIDGKTVYLIGVGVHSKAACQPGLPNPGPLLVVVLFTTGANAVSFLKCWKEWTRIVTNVCGAAPAAMMSDMDTVFLGPMGWVFLGYATYAEYKQYLWDETLKAYDIMVAALQASVSATDFVRGEDTTVQGFGSFAPFPHF